ncbi:hypothetical protein EJB05_47055, partial [Eragrostis curvula]
MEISQALPLAPLLFLFTCLFLHMFSATPRNNTNGLRIPSPPALPIVGHLHLLKRPLHRSLPALAARYGASTGLLHLRFGNRQVLLVSSPAIANECFTVHDVALADRPGRASRRLIGDDCPAIGSANYGPLWRQLRRLATVHALCANRVGATATTRNAEARAMAAKLWRAGPGEVAVKSIAYEFVANAIMVMVSGKRMSEEQVIRFKAMTDDLLAVALAANRQDFLPVLRLFDFWRTARKHFGQSLIDDYREKHHHHNPVEGTPRTVIGDLLREQDQSPESLSDVVTRTVCLSLLQAGSDTSTGTIEWAMALLFNNPGVLKQARAEIDSVVGKSRMIQESDLATLPYLNCVIMETLRLYPINPNLVPHEVSQDCKIAGYAVTRGTMVLIDVYSMQRDPHMWIDPEKFMPERFLGPKGNVNSNWMIPFGMGRRKCPGEGLALKIVGMALGTMIQCFEWERIGDKEVDMSEGSRVAMPMAVPLVAMCRPRIEMESVLKTL